MATRQFQLSEDEIRAFRQAEAQTRDVRELKRLQAVRLYGMGESKVYRSQPSAARIADFEAELEKK